MPLTFVALEWLEWNEVPPKDVFSDWGDWANPLTPREVANAVEGMFEEQNLAQSVAHIRGLVTTRNKSFCDLFGRRLVDRLVVLLQRDKHLDLQCEAVHTLFCIGEDWRDVRRRFWPHSRVFVDLLSSSNATLREKTAGILKVFSPRAEVVQDGTVKGLYRLACSARSAHELESAVDTLSLLLQSHCQSEFEFIAPDLPTFVMFLHSANPAVATRAAAGLLRITCNYIDAALQAGALPPTAELLKRTPIQDPLFLHSLEIVSSITRGSEQHVQAIIDHDLLRVLQSTLKADSFRIGTIACHAIANICAGSQHQVQRVIELGIFEDLISILHSTRNQTIWPPAACAITNATNQASSEQMLVFVELGCVQILSGCAFDRKPRSTFTKIGLRGLHKFLKFGATQSESGQNAIAELVKETSANNFSRVLATAEGEVRELLVAVLEFCEVEPPNA